MNSILDTPRIISPRAFPFVETAVSKSVWAYIDLVRKWGKIGLLIAESQTGKSRAIHEFIARNPKLDILYHQVPVGGHKSKVVLQLCRQRGISTKYNTPEREERLAESITPDTLIIPDEIQQCASRIRAGGRMTAERVDTMEYYRWLRDTRGCPILYIGTSEALAMLQGRGAGHESGGIFIQTLKRSLDPLILKNHPPRRDLNAFADKVDLKPAEGAAKELQDRTVIERGLEIWLTYLLAGVEHATNQDRRVTWEDVHAAVSIFKPEARRDS